MSVTQADVFAELSAQLGGASVGDPYPVFAEHRRANPIMTGDIMAEFGLPAMAQSLDGSRPMFTFFGYKDVAGALRDAQTYSSSAIAMVFEPVLGRTVLGMDGQEHRVWRGMLSPAFSRRLIEMWQTQIIRPVARRYAEELAAAGKSANLAGFGLRFPVRMIYEILGFRPEETPYEDFARGGLTMLLALSGVNPSNPEETARVVARAIEEAQGLYARLKPIVQRRRAEGSEGDDFIGRLLRTEFEGAKLDDDQIAVFLRSLLPAAAETTTRTWLNVMTVLLTRPETLEAIRSDRELLPLAIAEATRLEPAATVLGRITTKSVTVRSVEIPEGAGITLAIASANRDEDVYENPDQFDLHRSGPPALSFGGGPHVCVGQNTARIEMQEATEALFDTLPNLRLDPGAPRPEVRGMMMRSPAGLLVVWD